MLFLKLNHSFILLPLRVTNSMMITYHDHAYIPPWRFETEVPLLMSPLHTYSMRLKKERHGRKKQAQLTSTSSTPSTTVVTRRPPMPLPIPLNNPNSKHHQPDSYFNFTER